MSWFGHPKVEFVSPPQGDFWAVTVPRWASSPQLIPPEKGGAGCGLVHLMFSDTENPSSKKPISVHATAGGGVWWVPTDWPRQRHYTVWMYLYSVGRDPFHLFKLSKLPVTHWSSEEVFSEHKSFPISHPVPEETLRKLSFQVFLYAFT